MAGRNCYGVTLTLVPHPYRGNPNGGRAGGGRSMGTLSARSPGLCSPTAHFISPGSFYQPHFTAAF